MNKEFLKKETANLRELYGMTAVPERIEQVLKEKGYERVIENWYTKGECLLILATIPLEGELVIINALYLEKISKFKDDINSKINKEGEENV